MKALLLVVLISLSACSEAVVVEDEVHDNGLFTDKEDSTSQVDNQIDPKLITIGMGPDDVRAIFGDPDNESTVGIETVWTYGDYMITFIDSIEGSPAETLNE